uniref:VLIG-type G domain-containing protein n=1 Tax=Cyprinodon variegatus TaxID=28743 RepID=A0A3Q2DM88_CYPVA
MDIFNEPVAIANLRGDIASFETQFSFLCQTSAALLLDGFPLELVDGDASNIPLRWVTDVLSQLNDLVSPKNKIVVVTVLGVQSTGKSTLLNTMFGVQFAVSSGRCTRGAFMLFIKVNEDFKKVLKCDFMVIIDTEGLKSPELAQLENSYEHDNELATLVVGLSDITIINIAMENSTEMKDILQIVVHAFLRMKEVKGSRKPKYPDPPCACSNVVLLQGVSAHPPLRQP